MIGNEHDAWAAWDLTWQPYHNCYNSTCTTNDDAVQIGAGESRTVWLIGGVAYKAGRLSANRHEHEVLTAWRKAGAAWAPETALYTFVADGHMQAVVAMPYLPNDEELDAATLAEIRKVAPQTCFENCSAHDGQTYLIDGGDIECRPIELKQTWS